MRKLITAHEASIRTLSVEIKTLTVSGKSEVPRTG